PVPHPVDLLAEIKRQHPGHPDPQRAIEEHLVLEDHIKHQQSHGDHQNGFLRLIIPGHYLKITIFSITQTSICVFRKQAYASAGPHTMGSSRTLKLVLISIPSPVSASNAFNSCHNRPPVSSRTVWTRQEPSTCVIAGNRLRTTASFSLIGSCE